MHEHMTSYFRGIWPALTVVGLLTGCGNLPSVPDKPSPYRLGAGDELEVQILGANEVTGKYLVQDDGTIKMLLIGEVPAAGLTLNQLQDEIDEKAVAGGYLKQPHASVQLLSYRPYFIMGEVAGQGDYPYVSGMRVLSAAAAAGGYTNRANQSHVIITRNGEDYSADPMTLIEPGDIIRVPAR